MYAGKAIAITGAGAGIGRALTLQLAARGGDVFALDRDEQALTALVEDAAKFGHTVYPVVGDVMHSGDLESLRDKALATKQRLDIWINNAGVAGLGGFLEQGEASFERVLDIDLRALVRGTRLALETMEQVGSGWIVNMASVAGRVPAPYMTAYATAKHAVIGFTRSLQAELRQNDSLVRLALVCPGFVDTSIIARGQELGFPEWLSFMLATPDGVARAVIRGLEKSDEEIWPTWNGKLMKNFYGLFPGATVASSRMLLARDWKDLLQRRTRIRGPSPVPEAPKTNELK